MGRDGSGVIMARRIEEKTFLKFVISNRNDVPTSKFEKSFRLSVDRP